METMCIYKFEAATKSWTTHILSNKNSFVKCTLRQPKCLCSDGPTSKTQLDTEQTEAS
jgi:hypothetical protein